MTKTDHLAKAKDYIAKGEDYYRKAADEITAAMDADPTLSYREIARRLGRSDHWVGELVRWSTNAKGSSQATPYGGAELATKKDQEKTRRVLRDADLRREVIADLNADERAEVVRDIAAASTPDPEPRRNLHEEMDDAVATDLSAQVAKLIAGASRIDLLLAERGAEFRRIDSETAARMDADLERVVNTIRDVRTELLKHREIGVTS